MLAALEARPAMGRLGGYDFLDDPNIDARDADPVWLPDPDPLLAIGPSPDDEADRFNLWSMPGRKSLVHDGKRLILKTTLGRRIARLALDRRLNDGRAYAFAIPAGPRASAKRKAADNLDAMTCRNRVGADRGGVTRSDLVHMRAYHALDLAEAGASEREIALALFPRGGTDDWNDSALRAQVRYILRHGRAFRDGRYRELLRSDFGELPSSR